MPFVPVPVCAEATIHYILDGQDEENTLWFQNASPPTGIADLDALADALRTWVIDDLMSNYSQNLVANFMTVIAQDAIDSPGVTRNLGPTNGGVAVAFLPNEVSLALGFRTASRGRGARGRNFIPCLNEGAVVGNNVTSGFMTGVQLSYEGLNAAIAASGWNHVVVSRFSGSTIVGGKKVPTPRVAGIPSEVTAYVFADNVVDSQRRRGPGRGR